MIGSLRDTFRSDWFIRYTLRSDGLTPWYLLAHFAVIGFVADMLLDRRSAKSLTDSRL